jgi:hypothetical protein
MDKRKKSWRISRGPHGSPPASRSRIHEVYFFFLCRWETTRVQSSSSGTAEAGVPCASGAAGTPGERPLEAGTAGFTSHKLSSLQVEMPGREGWARLRSVLRIRMDPYNFPGSRSISCSNEHNKINWKGKFNKVCLLVGSCRTYWQGKLSKKMYTSTVLGTLWYLFETVRIRFCIKLKSSIRIRIKAKSRIRIGIQRVWIHNTG